LRIAALAFGILAGLVASLILALGGLDPEMLPRVDPRQLHFALFVIANLGVFAAALALAAPLAAAVLMLLAAAAWAGAAFLLRHGPDYVLITPPALLAIAAAFAIIAFVLRPRTLDAPGPATEGEDLQAAPQQSRGLEQGEQVRADSDWQPGKKKLPTRQEPVFRDPEDEDEESGFARFFRGISTVLSFGLYAALAGAAVLIFLNLRTGDTGRPTPALEARSSSSLSTPPTASSAAPAAPVLTSPSSSDPIEAVQTLLSTESGGAAEGTGTFRTVGPAPGPAAEASAASLEPIPPPASSDSSAVFVSSGSSEVPVQLEPQNLLADSPSSSIEPPPTASPSAPVLPFGMPTQMAAERQRPAPAPSQAAPPATAGGDTGL
jgi:hypothetical protein